MTMINTEQLTVSGDFSPRQLSSALGLGCRVELMDDGSSRLKFRDVTGFQSWLRLYPGGRALPDVESIRANAEMAMLWSETNDALAPFRDAWDGLCQQAAASGVAPPAHEGTMTITDAAGNSWPIQAADLHRAYEVANVADGGKVYFVDRALDLYAAAVQVQALWARFQTGDLIASPDTLFPTLGAALAALAEAAAALPRTTTLRRKVTTPLTETPA